MGSGGVLGVKCGGVAIPVKPIFLQLDSSTSDIVTIEFLGRTYSPINNQHHPATRHTPIAIYSAARIVQAARVVWIASEDDMSANFWDSTQRRFWQFSKDDLAAKRQKLEDDNAEITQAFPLPQARHLYIYFNQRLSPPDSPRLRPPC